MWLCSTSWKAVVNVEILVLRSSKLSRAQRLLSLRLSSIEPLSCSCRVHIDRQQKKTRAYKWRRSWLKHQQTVSTSLLETGPIKIPKYWDLENEQSQSLASRDTSPTSDRAFQWCPPVRVHHGEVPWAGCIWEGSSSAVAMRKVTIVLKNEITSAVCWRLLTRKQWMTMFKDSLQ